MHLPFSSSTALSLALSLLSQGAYSLPQGKRSDEKDKADPGPQLDVEAMEKWCAPHDNMEDMESATAAMDMVNPAAALDKYLREVNHGTKDWLENLPEYAFESGSNNQVKDCAIMGSGITCDPGHSNPGNGDWTCWNYFRESHFHQNDRSKNTFWIYETVKGMHAKLSLIRDELASNTLRNSLQVTEMIEAFGADKDWTTDANGVYAGFVTGLAVTGALAGAVPGPGAIIGGAASAASALLDAFEPEPEAREVKLGSIGTELLTRYDTAKEIMERALAAAVGRETQDGDYEKLRNLKSDSDLEHGASKLLDKPFWLLSNDKAINSAIFDKAKLWTQLRMAHSVLRAMKMDIVTKEKNDKDDCEGGENFGRRWLEVDGKHWCFGLYYPQDGTRERNKANQMVFDALTKYGVDAFSKFYLNAIDCAKNGGPGENGRPDASVMVDNYLPRCFYSLPVLNYKEDYSYPYTRYFYNPFFAPPAQTIEASVSTTGGGIVGVVGGVIPN